MARPRKRSELSNWITSLLVVLLILTQAPGTVFGSSTVLSGSMPQSTVSADSSQLFLNIGEVSVGLQPMVDASLGQLQSFGVQDSGSGPVAKWSFDNGALEAGLDLVPQGAFLRVEIHLTEGCSCQADVKFALGFTGANPLTPKRTGPNGNIESIILSTTPLTEMLPPNGPQVLIQAMDYYAVSQLYGVAAALVLAGTHTVEVVSLYPFASIAYDPSGRGSVQVAFRKGMADLSTRGFQSGDAQSIMFYVGSADARETTSSAFTAFAQDVEKTFPTRDSGKKFFAYGVDGGSWDDVRREAESLGLSLVYSSKDWQFTNDNGGGHYVGLGWETMKRLTSAGLVSALVLGRDGNSIGDSVCVRINPGVPELQAWIQHQIDALVGKRQWFFADGVGVVQDFNMDHTNALEGYIQALLHVRSTGREVIYNPFHKPRLWLDWIADGAMIEAPTGLFRFGGGPRVDYLGGSGEVYAATRDFMRVRTMFFPSRVTIWHDYVSLADSSLTDSIALFLMSGANSFSFTTNSSGWVNVRPGEITKAVEMLSKMDSIRRLSLGQVSARGFEDNEVERSWKFQALSTGNVTWLGKIDHVLVDNKPCGVSFNGASSTFLIAGTSSVTLVYNGN